MIDCVVPENIFFHLRAKINFKCKISHEVPAIKMQENYKRPYSTQSMFNSPRGLLQWYELCYG